MKVQKERKKQICMTKGSWAGSHTRWRGLAFFFIFIPVRLCHCHGGIVERDGSCRVRIHLVVDSIPQQCVVIGTRVVFKIRWILH